MTRPQEPKIQKLTIADIVVDLGVRRRVSSNTVNDLVVSIGEIGVMTNPIIVRKLRRKSGERLVLIDGAHRLTAATKMGWDEIPARVWADISDDQARLMECDANFARAELNVLEKGLALVERKGIYENIHPETKAGGDRRSPDFSNQMDTMSVWSFAKSTAEKLGINEKSVRRLVAAVSSLTASESKQLRRLSQPISLKDLMLLSKVKDNRLGVQTGLGSGDAVGSEITGVDFKFAARPIVVDVSIAVLSRSGNDALFYTLFECYDSSMGAWVKLVHTRNKIPASFSIDSSFWNADSTFFVTFKAPIDFATVNPTNITKLRVRAAVKNSTDFPTSQLLVDSADITFSQELAQ